MHDQLLSPSTQDEDMGRKASQGKQPGKWQVYEQILGVPYYITFNRYNNDELQAFQLAGNRYQAIELLGGKLWIPDLDLGLALWQGEYRGKGRQWLRWYDADGNWIPTEAEKVEQAEQRAQQAEQRAEELAQRLRELGLNP